MTLYEELKWRGLIKDISSDELIDKLNKDKLTFYWGTDPTADSLHLGHYSSLVTAKRVAKYGHRFILLVGGATGLIGDPRPTAEREIISVDTINKNLNAISNQVKKLVDENTIFSYVSVTFMVIYTYGSNTFFTKSFNLFIVITTCIGNKTKAIFFI